MTEFRKQLLERMAKVYGSNHCITTDFERVLKTCPEGEEHDKRLTLIVERNEQDTPCDDED